MLRACGMVKLARGGEQVRPTRGKSLTPFQHGSKCGYYSFSSDSSPIIASLLACEEGRVAMSLSYFNMDLSLVEASFF